MNYIYNIYDIEIYTAPNYHSNVCKGKSQYLHNNLFKICMNKKRMHMHDARLTELLLSDDNVWA